LNKLVLILLFILIQDLRGIPSINSVFYNLDCNYIDELIINNGIITIYGKNLICEEQTLSLNNYKNNIRIYPNPTNDVFYICSDKGYDIKIYDLQGRYLTNKANLFNYQNGIYLVKVKIENNTKILRIIKK